MTTPLVCPVCSTESPGDAAFCTNTACHKALGGFRYIGEELASRARPFERLAQRITGFVGTPHFLIVHALWFVIWIALNAAGIVAFDDFPFNLLAIILAIEAIFITGLLLVGGNRQTNRAQMLGELDYEVSVTTFRKLTEVDAALQAVLKRLERLEFLARERRDRAP